MTSDSFARWDRELASEEYSDGVFGIMLKLCEAGSNESRTCLIPWLTFDREHANHLLWYLTSANTGTQQLLADFLLSGEMNLPDGRWSPIAGRIVKLAVVPF